MKINEYGYLETNLAFRKAEKILNNVEQKEIRDRISLNVEKEIYPVDSLHSEEKLYLRVNLKYKGTCPGIEALRKDRQKSKLFKCNKHFNFLNEEIKHVESFIQKFSKIIYEIRELEIKFWELDK